MSYIDVQETSSEVVCWERDDEGELLVKRFPSSNFHYLFIPDNTGSASYKDLYGNPMKKVSFESRWKMREYTKSHDNTCEADVQPVYRYLMEHMAECNVEAPYNLLFFDIEVDFDLSEGTGYPTPKNPFGEINSISCFDQGLNQYVMFIPIEFKGKVTLTDDECPVEIIWCSHEREMLKEFCDYIKHCDILTGWNSASFDIPYIMERLINNFGSDAETMLCRNGFKAKKREFTNEYDENVWEWTLAGRTHLDLMQLFKKFVPGEAKSFKLDAVCERELGMNKVEFEDDLGELYRENPQKFFEYSLHDSRLLKLLDETKQVIRLGMSMAREMCALPNDVLGSVKIIDMGLMKYARKKDNIVFPSKTSTEKDEKFDGAIVYDTIPGKHSWVFGIDLRSLYPFTIMMLGLSPETMLIQCKGEYEDFVKVVTDDDSDGKISVYMIQDEEEFDLYPSELHAIIKEEGYTISGNGTVFTGEMGIVAGWLDDNFKMRKKYKELSKKYFNEGDKVLGERYDMYQQVRKINLNSCYGALGNAYFRMFDIRMAASVTISAQVVSKQQAYAANEAIEIMMEDD